LGRKSNKNTLQEMEKLLEEAMQPGSRLYAYMEGELKGPENSGKPDAKPLRDVLAVIREIRELRQESAPRSITIRFEDPEGYSE